jgi:hypothetical protein
MILTAEQQWTMANILFRVARISPPPRRDQLVSRARFFVHFAQWQCQHPDHPRTAKTPCPPETLIEMEFAQAMVAALSRRSPRPQT